MRLLQKVKFQLISTGFQINKKNLLKRLQSIGLEAFEASFELRVIIEKIFGKKDFYEDSLVFSKEQLAQIDRIFELREKHVPLQYIFNEGYFFGEKYYIDENVLIPRPETELLVEECINNLIKYDNASVLDIGTGSGCIAITLSKTFKNIKMTACDISQKALEVARKNANELNANVNFVHSDIFSDIEGKFNLIVSNPPYIPKTMKNELQKEVLKEPELALFTEDTAGIEFYKKIITQAKKFLEKNGMLIFELQLGQAKLVEAIFKENNYHNIIIKKDYNNIERIISAFYE